MASLIGVDVCKTRLDVESEPPGFSTSVDNTLAGFAQLIRLLNALPEGVQKVVMEATGGYERQAARTLRDAGFTVQIVHPSRARFYAKAMGKQAKTDKIDASLLARYGGALESEPCLQASIERDKVRELLQTREGWVQTRDDSKRRLEHIVDSEVRAMIGMWIVSIDKQIKQLEETLELALAALEGQKILRARSIRGVGLVAIATLISYLPELGTLSRRTVASLAGVAPWNNDSGNTQGPRSIRGGRARLRHGLYMPMWSILRWNPDLQDRYTRLIASHKLPKVALIACMKSFLIRLNAMLRDGTEWQSGEIAAD
jgi:transposase